jgi:hypothetical protein
LNFHNVSDVRQKYITAESLVPGPSHFEVEISIAKLKTYKSPGSVQILAELYQAGGETLVSVTHKLVASIWNKEELTDRWKEYLFTRRMIKLTVVTIVGYHCYQLHTKFYQISFFYGYVYT